MAIDVPNQKLYFTDEDIELLRDIVDDAVAQDAHDARVFVDIADLPIGRDVLAFGRIVAHRRAAPLVPIAGANLRGLRVDRQLLVGSAAGVA